VAAPLQAVQLVIDGFDGHDINSVMWFGLVAMCDDKPHMPSCGWAMFERVRMPSL